MGEFAKAVINFNELDKKTSYGEFERKAQNAEDMHLSKSKKGAIVIRAKSDIQ